MSGRGARVVAALIAALLGSGCGVDDRMSAAPERVVLLTQVPDAATVDPPRLGDRLAPGSRLVRIDWHRPQKQPLVLSEGLHAAGYACVSAAGDRVLFEGRERIDAPRSIWTCRIDGSERRRVSDPATDCASAAWLPDGRVVFSSAVSDAADPAGIAAGRALFVTSLDDGPAQRITYGPSAFDPTLLRDGRVLFCARRALAAGAGGRADLSLFVVHPDGTGIALFHADPRGPVERVRPRQGTNATLLFLDAGSTSDERVRAVDWADPSRVRGWQPGVPGDVLSLEAVPQGGWLAVIREPAVRNARLFRLDAGGALQGAAWRGNPAWQVVHAVDAQARPRPQGHLSSVDASTAQGSLLCLDARRPDASNGRSVRLVRHVAAGAQTLGELSLESDGSFFASVPANAPLTIEVIDAKGRVVRASHTPFWVRPGEIRACVGCHEAPDRAPPNHRPRAVSHAAVVPGEGSDER